MVDFNKTENFTNINGTIVGVDKVTVDPLTYLDKFNDATIDPAIWNIGEAAPGSVVEAGGFGVVTGDGANWNVNYIGAKSASKFTPNIGQSIYLKAKSSAGTICQFGLNADSDTVDTNAGFSIWIYPNGTDLNARVSTAGGAPTFYSAIGTLVAGTEYTYRIEFDATDHIKLYQDANEVLSITVATAGKSYRAAVVTHTNVMSVNEIWTDKNLNTGQVLIADSGQTYQDAADSKYWNNALATIGVTGSLITALYLADHATDQGFADAAAVESGVTWTGPYTIAEVVALVNSELRFRYMKAEITAVTLSDSFDEYTCDVGTVDITDPTASDSIVSHRETHTGDEFTIIVAATCGHDEAGGSGIEGMSLAVKLDDDSILYLQADYSWAATEADVLYKGSADAREVFYDVNFDEGTPLYYLLTTWDKAGNYTRTAWILFGIAIDPDFILTNVPLPAIGKWVATNVVPDNLLLDVTAGVDNAIIGTVIPSGGASSPATSLSVADNLDGVTWLVTTAGQAADSAIYIYDQSDDALVTIIDSVGLTKDLTAGTEVYCKILESNKTLSTRFPVSTGAAVPALAAPTIPSVAEIVITDREDGTGSDAVVSDLDSGATNNALYYRVNGVEAWTLLETFTAAKTIAIDTDNGFYDYKLSATNAAGTNCDNGVFTVTDSSAKIANYKVSQILRIPGTGYKEVFLERLDRPIDP